MEFSLLQEFLSIQKAIKKMNQISDAISEGANAYMKRQYTVISFIGLIIL